MIHAVIEGCVRNKFLVILLTAAVIALGLGHAIRRSRRVEYGLLLALFPSPIIRALKNDEPVSQHHERVSVLFADLVGFTAADG